MRYFCIALIGAAIALCYVMLSFQYTFSVDDVYDVVGPRELNAFEKITIRVNKVPKEFADLKRFVEYHGICPAVHEIQVPWRFAAGSNSASASTHSGKVGSASASAAPYNEEPPRPELFIFEKTHARLTFVTTETEVGCNKDPKFETEGVLFMDVDVFLPCVDIKRAIEALRSSQDSAIGAFPRLHSHKSSSRSATTPPMPMNPTTSTASNAASDTAALSATATTSAGATATASASVTYVAPRHAYEYRGWPSVLWNRAYSLLLSSAIVVHKKYVESLCASPEHLAEIERILHRNSGCLDLVWSLWLTSQGARGPSYLPASYSTKSLAHPLHSPEPSHASRSECLNELASALKISQIPYSVHKSVDSREDWVW